MNDSRPPFAVVDHMADWALQVKGRTLADLLLNAAHGMNYLLIGRETDVALSQTRSLHLDALDAEDLLVSWLGELAFWAEMEQLIFTEMVLTNVTGTALDATLRGGPVPSMQKHIKAVTYHELDIVETAVGLTATVVFDV